MKQIFLSSVLFLIAVTAFCQRDSLDIITYKFPGGWQKKEQANLSVYSFINKKDNSWCQIGVYKSTASKGNIDADFESEWNELAATPYKITEVPEKSSVQEADGWKIMSGSGKFRFNDSNAVVIVTTFSGYGRCISIVATTANQRYLQDIIDFIGTIELKKPVTAMNDMNTLASNDFGPDNTQRKDGYTFSTTNFDDGWTSVAKENWIEVTKNGVKVLLHYPNKTADAYNSVLKEEDYNAWNVLVVPRYNNVQNFEWGSIQSWESISFMQADATEKATGKAVHLVLFKKHYSNGNGRYLEFITNNKATYEKEFGAYQPVSYGWEKPAAMQYRNKFSVAANDLIGSWTTSDYASISYYYINTGGLAGTSTTSTADEFHFLAGNNYQSQHSGASGEVGNTKFSNQVYKGKSTVTNWNIILTNRFEGATETYDAYFEAIKGGRILIMTDRLKTTRALVKK